MPHKVDDLSLVSRSTERQKDRSDFMNLSSDLVYSCVHTHTQAHTCALTHTHSPSNNILKSHFIFNHMHTCVRVHACVCRCLQKPERASDLLELERQAVVSCPVVYWKSSKQSPLLSHLTSSLKCFSSSVQSV